ncbi:MAG: TRAP transporter small permease subunit [Parvularculaceae bacterium]
MQIPIGDILNVLAAGLLFPASLIPLAALVRGRMKSAIVFALLVFGIVAAAYVFSSLAVDLEPLRAPAALIAGFAASVFVLFLVVARMGAAPLMARALPVIEAVVRGIGRLSIWLVLAMAAIQFAGVILRYVFGVNFIAMQESVTYLHGAVFLLAGGYALITDDHVRVDIFYREASPRRKAIVNLAGTYLFLLPFCFVALWAAAPYVGNSWAVREGSIEQSGIKGVYLLKSLIPIYLTLLALAGVAMAARASATLAQRDG